MLQSPSKQHFVNKNKRFGGKNTFAIDISIGSAKYKSESGETTTLAEGSAEKVALHALVGGLMAEINGGKFGDGLTVGAINEIVIAEIIKNTDLSAEEARWFSAMLGYGLDDPQGAAIADSATRNNAYQHLPIIKQVIKKIKDSGFLERLADDEVIMVSVSADVPIPYLGVVGAGGTTGFVIDKFGRYYEVTGLSIGTPGLDATYAIVKLADIPVNGNKEITMAAVKARLTENTLAASASFLGASVNLSLEFDDKLKISSYGVGLDAGLSSTTISLGSVSGAKPETKEYGNIYDSDFFNMNYDYHRLLKEFYLNNPPQTGEEYKSYYFKGVYILLKTQNGITSVWDQSAGWRGYNVPAVQPNWLKVEQPFS
jgi:hypothetical protein